MVIAIWYSNTKMLLEPKQTWLLKVITVVGLIISTFIYWLMTCPIMSSVQKLIELTKQFSDKHFETRYKIGQEAREFKELAKVFQQMEKS